MGSLVEDGTAGFKCSNPSRWTEENVSNKVLNKQLHNCSNQIRILRHPSKAAYESEIVLTVPGNRKALTNEGHREEDRNRINPDMCPMNEKLGISVVQEVDKAINFYQTDHIADARESLQKVFQIMPKTDAGCFEFPTQYGRQVLDRGKELFLKGGVSSSVKHGTLILDSSNGGARFYFGLLNVVGAFAVTISEYELGGEIFSLLKTLHRAANVATYLRDLGAVYNNAGCILLIKGDYKQAELNFNTSLKNFKSAEKLQSPHRVNSAAEKVQRSHSSLLDVMLITVKSNVSRLLLISRNFGESLVKQEQVVESCKAKKSELPVETVFTVLNNQAVLHTTLTDFEKAEQALEWLKWYYMEKKREDCDYLLNFASLHLCEVLLFAGKSKRAEKEFSLETLTSAHGTELSLMFGGLHINVRTEAFEKLVDVLVLRGKVKFACGLLEKGLSILQKSFGPDHFNVASLLYKQGVILSLVGEFSNSLQKFERSIAILEGMFGVTHPLLLKVYMSLGDVALTLKRRDKSFYYFQRAMENIEELYKVSFVSQLSTEYAKMTKEIKHSQDFKIREDKTECLVKDLVAEYGLAFAVLLSRIVVQKNNGYFGKLRTKGKRPFTTKNLSVQRPDTMAIISLKCTRDFLQSGQSFLRQGMMKEAAAFFQRASKYYVAHQIVKGPPNHCLARLYGILAKTSLERRESLEDYGDLIDCLKELSEVSTVLSTESDFKGATKDIPMTTSDSQLTLRLVLIFLIRLSIELKVIDVTFEAYDLYAKLSYNDAGFMFFHNGGIQFYASRTSITCNGKTAVQDVLVSSTIGLNGGDSECPLPEKQLFRNLACKKNVPTDSFLVTYSSSILLDIDELQKLEKKISLSVQECFQLKCFEAGIYGNATQVLVDLSSKSTCNIVAVGKRIELLSLCLSEEMNTDVTRGGEVSKISTAMRQETKRLTFEDEQTSRFIFSKNVLSLLQQFKAGNISAVSVEHQCLALTIVHPVKARLTLRRNSRCIAQELQFVQTSTRHDLTDRKVSQQTLRELPDGSLCSAIDNLANKYHVACETDVADIDLPVDDSDAYNQQTRNPLDTQQLQETYSQVFSHEYEQNETLRICLNACVLEGLSTVSEISRQLFGGSTQEYGNVIEVLPDIAAPGRFPSFSESHLQQENLPSTSQQVTFNPENDSKTRRLNLEGPHLATVEDDPRVRVDNSMSRTEDDNNELGKSLFEKHRRLRRSFFVELQESLKRKQTSGESNAVNPEEEIQNGIDVAGDKKKDTASHVVTSEESDNNPRCIEVIFNSGEQAAFNAEDDLKPQRLSEPWLRDKKSTAADDKNALGRHIFEKDGSSTNHSTAKLKEPNMEKTSQKGDRNTATDKITSGKQNCVKDESSPVLGGSGQVAEEEDKQRTIETTITNLIAESEVENAGFLTLCQSETHSSVQDQTGHRHQDTLHEVHRPTTHSPTYVEKGLECSQSEAVKDHITSKRYEEEMKVSKVQNEPLGQKEIPKPVSYVKMIKKITPGSRFEFDEDVVADGPSSGTSRRTHSNANDLMPSTNTHVVNKPLERVGKNIQTEPDIVFNKEVGMWTPRKSNVDDTCNEALQNDTRSTERLQLHHGALKKTTFRHPYRGCRGGDVFVDGDSRNASLEEDDVVDGPAVTSFESFANVGGVGIHKGETFKSYQNDGKKVSGKGVLSCQSHAARDVVDAPVYSSKINSMVKDIPSDFGGARPKERSTNVIKSISTTKPGMTQSSLACQYEETATPGINPHFQALHTLKSNGAILETPLQDHYDDPYFSAKAMACNENVREPWVRFNQPGYASKGSKLGLYVEEDYANRPSTRGDGQSLASYQKLPLWQNESWHFPPLEIAETTATQGNFFVDQGYATQQHSLPVEDSILSEVKAPFNSRESQNAYNEMDSITSEYHNSIGNFNNGPVQSPMGIASQQSSTEDSTSSLLGSLQQLMAKTVKLITSVNAVGRQLRQEPREVEKRGIQEETGEHREQEEPLTPRLEDSTNQLESSQENEQALDAERQSISTPVQETPRPVCSHYQRRCLVRFPCCGKFYPCHRCHNESEDCSDDQARAINATHIRCTICYHEQPIDEHSQNCGECKSKMSEYFCPTCKHFTSVDKNPFHCDKCGICRIHRDRSFHCDVCNVCLDKRLQGKHKCRPDSGHDECCICLEDAFSGCQILPCSHKVHKDCAIAMIQNGVRTCPICRHPLFSQPQDSSQ